MKEKIIIVEDDQSILHFYSLICQQRGYEVIPYTNALECYKYISTKDNIDDIFCIITDINLKENEWSGYSLASALNLTYPGIPIIAISGYLCDYSKVVDFQKIFRFAFSKPVLTMQLLFLAFEVIRLERQLKNKS